MAMDPAVLDQIQAYIRQRRATGRAVNPTELRAITEGALSDSSKRALEQGKFDRQMAESTRQFNENLALKKKELDSQRTANTLMGIGTLGMLGSRLAGWDKLKKIWPWGDKANDVATPSMPGNDPLKYNDPFATGQVREAVAGPRETAFPKYDPGYLGAGMGEAIPGDYGSSFSGPADYSSSYFPRWEGETGGASFGTGGSEYFPQYQDSSRVTDLFDSIMNFDFA